MADKPADKTFFPTSLTQNPSPVVADTQDRKAKVQEQTNRILSTLMQALPSNYVSQVTGPYYTLQLQAAAEQIAEFQIQAQETFDDRSYDYLRPEFLFQILGACVFPDAESAGYPKIEGDLSYREFLKRMVVLLLEGSKGWTLQQGIELLTNATVSIIEKGISARALGSKSAWGPKDMFTIEVNVSDERDIPVTGESHVIPTTGLVPLSELRIDPATVRVWDTGRITEYYGPYAAYGLTQDFHFVAEDGASPLTLELTSGSRLTAGMTILVDYTRHLDQFPADPFTLQENVRLVLRALKPAHVLYDYRHLFHEVFTHLFTETRLSWTLDARYYEDYRRYWRGMKSITGTAGTTWTDRSLFSDMTRDFSAIQPGADLVVLDGPNGVRQAPDVTTRGYVGRYRVREVRVFPVGPDSTPRAYTRSGGGSGTLVTHEDCVEDVGAGDFGNAVEGETLTILAGPNAGTYRMAVLLGPYGHEIVRPAGLAPPPPGYKFKQVRLAPCLLRIEGWMKEAATGQSYTVGVDRLGVQVPRFRHDDVSEFFWR